MKSWDLTTTDLCHLETSVIEKNHNAVSRMVEHTFNIPNLDAFYRINKVFENLTRNVNAPELKLV